MPDWQVFQRFNGSTREFYGLWAYCQDQAGTLGTVCKRWPTAENQLFNGSRPNFIRTSEGLITTGMILLSFGLIAAIVAAALPLLAYLAAALAFLAFLLLVIGLPIFGRQSNDLSQTRGDATYNKRYGFWLMVPTIVLEFLSVLLLLGAAALYKLFGYGNLATSSSPVPTYGGRRVLGPPNTLVTPAYGTNLALPGVGGIASNPTLPVLGGIASNPYSSPAVAGRSPLPSLLSEYLTQRMPPYYSQTNLPPVGSGSLPQPSIMRALTPQSLPNVTPAYLRPGQPIGPRFPPIINLSGQTIIGPISRTT